MAKVTIPDLINATLRYYGIARRDLLGPVRHRQFAWPRQMVAWLARKHTEHSWPGIASFLHRGDHTTIIHAVWSIDKRMTPALQGELDAILALAADAAERRRAWHREQAAKPLVVVTPAWVPPPGLLRERMYAIPKLKRAQVRISPHPRP